MLRDNALRLRRYCSVTARHAWGLTPGWMPFERVPSAVLKAHLSTFSKFASPEEAIDHEEWLAALAKLWPTGQRAPKKIGAWIAGA